MRVGIRAKPLAERPRHIMQLQRPPVRGVHERLQHIAQRGLESCGMPRSESAQSLLVLPEREQPGFSLEVGATSLSVRALLAQRPLQGAAPTANGARTRSALVPSLHM